MTPPPLPTLSADELASATGEPIERLQHFQSLGLIGSEDRERYTSTDVERVHLIQFLERRQISLAAVARAEREESLLTTVMNFLYPRGVGRQYSFARAAEIVGLDTDVARRLREASASVDEMMDDHDVRMLADAKVALDAGFPEAALLQLVRVYADALGRVAEAEVRLFHFYVHEGLRATGLAGPRLTDSSRAVRSHMLPIVDPLIRYFHHRGIVKATREDMVLHLAGNRSPRPQGEPPDGRIVDRIGDAFLLVFPEPRAAVLCAVEIERRISAEPQFPALRGAVHWGDVVYQEGGYVGSSLNIASRVATQATPHQILVTAAARNEIGDLEGVTLAPVGRRELKGLVEERAVRGSLRGRPAG